MLLHQHRLNTCACCACFCPMQDPIRMQDIVLVTNVTEGTIRTAYRCAVHCPQAYPSGTSLRHIFQSHMSFCRTAVADFSPGNYSHCFNKHFCPHMLINVSLLVPLTPLQGVLPLPAQPAAQGAEQRGQHPEADRAWRQGGWVCSSCAPVLSHTKK
jgi:hypothetical protein